MIFIISCCSGCIFGAVIYLALVYFQRTPEMFALLILASCLQDFPIFDLKTSLILPSISFIFAKVLSRLLYKPHGPRAWPFAQALLDADLAEHPFVFVIEVSEIPELLKMQRMVAKIAQYNPTFSSVPAIGKHPLNTSWRKVKLNVAEHLFQFQLPYYRLENFLNSPFDLTKPLWDIHCIQSSKNVIIFRAHPALADPWALTQILTEHFEPTLHIQCVSPLSQPSSWSVAKSFLSIWSLPYGRYDSTKLRTPLESLGYGEDTVYSHTVLPANDILSLTRITGVSLETLLLTCLSKAVTQHYTRRFPGDSAPLVRVLTSHMYSRNLQDICKGINNQSFISVRLPCAPLTTRNRLNTCSRALSNAAEAGEPSALSHLQSLVSLFAGSSAASHFLPGILRRHSFMLTVFPSIQNEKHTICGSQILDIQILKQHPLNYVTVNQCGDNFHISITSPTNEVWEYTNSSDDIIDKPDEFLADLISEMVELKAVYRDFERKSHRSS